MTWFKLDDSFDTHPKVIAAGNAAVGVFCRCGVYCARHLTDGIIPKQIATMYGTSKEIRALLTVGLWRETDAGYEMPDFLEYQPSRDEIEERREKRAEAGRAGGQASAASRRKKAKREANASPNGQANVEHDVGYASEPPTRPVVKTLAPGFDEFWAAYPRHQDRVKAHAAFVRALKKTDLPTILAAITAQRLTEHDRQYVPYPTSWLNGERWNDEPVTPQQARRNREQSIERPDGVQMSGFYQ